MAAPDYPKARTDDLVASVKKWRDGEQFRPLDLGVKRAVSVVTCMDSRLMPATMFGLELGDAEYIRNAGGRVTPDVLRSLVVAQELLHTKAILLVQHSDCGGQAALQHHDVLADKVKRLGGSLDELGELFPISQGDDGVRASARQDFAKLRASKLINPLVEIRAFVYHTHKGELEEVASYTPKD